MKKCLGVLTLSFTLILIWASAQAGEKAPYRVGAILDISGPAALLGAPEKNTLKMIAEQINKQGGVNGHPLQLFIEDTWGREDFALRAATKLIKKRKVCALIGTSRSGTTLAIIPTVEEAQIPLLSCAAAEDIVLPPAERRFIFKTLQKDSDAVRRIYEHLVKKERLKIAIFTSTEVFGVIGRRQLKRIAPEFGLDIVCDETYEAAAKDFTASLARVKSSGAQAVVNWSIVPGQYIIPRNMHKLKMTIPLYQSHGFGNLQYVKAAGVAAEGIIFPASRLLIIDSLPADHPQKATLLAYKKQYETRYRDEVSVFGGSAYDALWLVINALKAVGPEPLKIRDQLEATEGFVGTGGVFNFSPQDHNGLDKSSFEMLTVKDGRFTILKE